MEENKELVEVIGAEGQALTQLSQEDLERAPRLGIQRVKPKNGKFVLHDDLVASSLNVIVLDHSRVNMYFKGPYVEGGNAKPDCYAADIHEAAMTPPRFVPARQADHCGSCWANQFESDPKGGLGKACRNLERMAALLHARPQVPGGVWAGILLEFQVPPTSMKAFAHYLDGVVNMRQRSTRSVVTRISLDPSSNFPKFIFEYVEDVAEKGLYDLIMKYPLGPQSAIREHLLRGWEYEAKETDDAPVDVNEKTAAEKVDDEIPF
jgi:hypothetical protein